MRQILLLPLAALLAMPVFSQTPADTTLTIRNIEIQGTRFAGLSERGGMKILRVDNNLSSVTNTAADAFRQLPSVITDMEGAVTYRGSGNVGMLVDGVPYGLLEEYSGDVLIQLPALFFNQISLGAFPPINAVPDGDAGILNLVPRMYGTGDSPLYVTLGAGWNERYNAGAVLNLHPGKFHINAKYNYRREYRERSFSKSTATAKNRTEMNNNATARPDVHVADMKVDYDLSAKDRITVHGLYHLMDYSRYGRINNRVFNPKGEQMKYVIRNRYNDQRQEAYAAEAYWNHEISENQGFYTVFNYNNFSYDEDNDFKNENPQNGNIVSEDNQSIDHTKHNYFWGFGYGQEIDGWDFKLGYIGRARNEDYLTAAFDKVDGSFELSPAKSYNYDFNRYLNLIYADVVKNWGAFNAEIGIQAEFSHFKMDEFSPSWINDPYWQGIKGKENKSSRFHLYPRSRFTYEVNKSNRLSLSYQQRAIRPNGSYLCSFLNNSDPTHIIQGNPDLKDEFIHNVELGYQFSAPRLRLTPAIYYRNRTNRIMETASQVNDETVWKKENIGHSQAVGADLSGSWNPVRILTVGFSGDIYRDEIDGRTIGYDEKKSLVCWDVKGNVNVSITPTTDFQVDGFYVSDQLTPQGKIKGRYSVNAGLSQYFLNRKLCANLSINNIFDSLEETTIIDAPNLEMTQKRNRDARVAWLTLTYSL
ncbi:MAG: TonB-dependent receptor domain-containing protein [Parabacteroides distasonis]|nr:TonB-dependent receptor family protein [Parabacteroides sp.]